MKLNEKSFLGTYYRWMFHGKLPNNFCILFWNILISMLLFPFIVINLISRDTWENMNLFSRFISGIILWIVTISFSLFGLFMINKYFPLFMESINSLPIIFQFLIGLLVFIISFALFSLVGIICIIILYYMHILFYILYKIIFKYKSAIKMKLLFSTIKNKFCLIIHWK